MGLNSSIISYQHITLSLLKNCISGFYGQYIPLSADLKEFFWTISEFRQWIIDLFCCGLIKPYRIQLTPLKYYWLMILTNDCPKLHLASIQVNFIHFTKIGYTNRVSLKKGYFIYSTALWNSLVQVKVVCLDAVLVKGVIIYDLCFHISV